MFDLFGFDPQSIVLGTVVIQDAGKMQNRRLVSLLGVVTIPDTLPVKNHWQYPIGGPSHMLRLCYAEGINREEELKGLGASNILGGIDTGRLIKEI